MSFNITNGWSVKDVEQMRGHLSNGDYTWMTKCGRSTSLICAVSERSINHIRREMYNRGTDPANCQCTWECHASKNENWVFEEVNIKHCKV